MVPMNASETSPQANVSVRMQRIKRVTRILQWLISAETIVVLVWVMICLIELVGGRVMPQGVQLYFAPGVVYSVPFSIPMVVLFLGGLRLALYLAGSLVLLWLLQRFEEGVFFTAQTVGYIKWLGWLLFGDWVVVRLLEVTHGMLSLDGQELIVCLVVVLIAWIMDEGRKIKEEQELTV